MSCFNLCEHRMDVNLITCQYGCYSTPADTIRTARGNKRTGRKAKQIHARRKSMRAHWRKLQEEPRRKRTTCRAKFLSRHGEHGNTDSAGGMEEVENPMKAIEQARQWRVEQRRGRLADPESPRRKQSNNMMPKRTRGAAAPSCAQAITRAPKKKAVVRTPTKNRHACLDVPKLNHPNKSGSMRRKRFRTSKAYTKEVKIKPAEAQELMTEINCNKVASV